MYNVILFICVIIGVASVVGLVLSICEQELKWIIICIIGLILCLSCGTFIDYNQPYLALGSPNVISEYAQVKDITSKSITLNNEKFEYNSIVQNKYPINFKEFKIGDVVHYEYVETGLNYKYLLKVEK